MALDSLMVDPGGSHAALLRRLQERLKRRDIDGLLADIDPDVEVRPVPELSGPFRGHEGVRRYIAAADSLDELTFDIQEMRELGERVVVLGRYRTRQGGSIVDNPAGWVVEVRDGKLRRSDAYASWGEAIDAAER